jgi:hypothetical protein
MKRLTKKRYVLSLLIVGGFLFNMILGATQVSAANLSTSESNDVASSRISEIKTYYLKDIVKKAGAPLRGIGYAESTQMEGTDCEELQAQLQENVIAMAALYKNFASQDDTESMNFAQNDIWPTIKKLRHTSGTRGYSPDEKIYKEQQTRKFAIDQFMFLEFTSESFSFSDNSEMLTQIQNMQRDSLIYQAPYNVSLHNIAPKGAYWTALENNNKYTSITPNSFGYNPQPQDNQYPLTNVSLWAAAGCAHFAKVQSDKDPASDYVGEARVQALNAMGYADIYTWNKNLGLYYENQNTLGTRLYRANTQIVGLLACARLYALTGDGTYLQKADTILSSLMKYFWDSGNGGVSEMFNPALPFMTMNKTGYDNALLGYALAQMAIATGSEDKDAANFFKFNRDTNKYMDMAEGVMAFMNNFMWDGIGERKGYIEWVTPAGVEATNTAKYALKTKAALTNMLALYTLATIVMANQTWWQWYFEYLIYVGIGLAVVLMVIILVVKKRSSGGKLPKIVKGLLGGDED